MFIKNAGSNDNGRMLQTGLDGSKVISDLSPDGNSILYQHQTETGAETYINGQSLIDGKPFLIGPGVEDELPRLSPDGGWMALPSGNKITCRHPLTARSMALPCRMATHPGHYTTTVGAVALWQLAAWL